MDPVTASLIEAVLLDALKILGPAVVAALATYKATSSQYRFKIKEIERSQVFKARENLLEHYKSQKLRIDDSYSSLSNDLGQILGMAASVSDGGEQEIEGIAGSFTGMSDMYVGIAPFDIRTTLRDMESLNLNETDEYRKLKSYLSMALELNATRKFEPLKANIYSLLEIYGFLQRCNHFILEHQIHSLFEEYVRSSK